MIAKEKQKILIKDYLKPTLESLGFLSSGQTWWKDRGDFFVLINMQNYSWNSKVKVDFCFNIGIALKVSMKDKEKKKPTVHDLTVYLRENFYLPDGRHQNNFRNNNGYSLLNNSNLTEFTESFKIDFENFIIPYLENLNSLQDCVEKFGNVSFWGERLKKLIEDNQLLMQ